MAKKYRYLGPMDFFIVDDHVYRKGDDVPLSEEQMQHHRLYGSQFEGQESAQIAPAVGRPEDLVPSDDLGRPMKIDKDGRIVKQKDAPVAGPSVGSPATGAAAS